ncbi:MAG: hypothetical protein VX656_14635 [Candidatus Latescibacterota bacterium]|nr:hypothetical protein [Candidatus Latescibacterota bacterium]
MSGSRPVALRRLVGGAGTVLAIVLPATLAAGQSDPSPVEDLVFSMKKRPPLPV